MKPKLIILSDLWGKEKSDWLVNYTDLLSSNFSIQFYDCCDLGKIDKSNYTEKNLHKQFVNAGIERALKTLFELEKGQVNILAFSIGGSIAWKFGIETNNINQLTCVSSTRLRYETIKPSASISLFYGSKDAYKPNDEWCKGMSVYTEIIPNKDHQCYTESDFAKKLCAHLIAKSLIQ